MVIHVHDHSNLLSFQFLICRGQFTRSVSVRHISLGFQEYILDLKSLKIFIHTSLFCTMYRLIYLSMKNRTKYIRRKLISILFQEGVQILQGGGVQRAPALKSPWNIRSKETVACPLFLLNLCSTKSLISSYADILPCVADNLFLNKN